MVRSRALAPLLATAAGLFGPAKADIPLSQPKTVPGQFIIEYAQNPVEGLLGGLLDPVQSLLNIGGLSIVKEFTSDIFNGALVSTPASGDPQDIISQLLGLGTVQQVWPNQYFEKLTSGVVPVNGIKKSPARRSYTADDGDDESSGSSGSTGTNSGSGDSSNDAPQADASGSESNATYATHISTQVDLLHAKGYFGDGIKIAVVDDGVDYTLDALGGCWGQGCLISFGKDLIGDKWELGDPPPVGNPTPLGRCGEGHGTHVMGIIAAQPGNDLGIIGAAPHATMGMYRVLPCEGGVTIDTIIQAFLDAFQDGANIITCSLSGPSGWKDDAWAVVVQRITQAGVIVTTSAGNTGDIGLFAGRQPAEATGNSAIASFTNAMEPNYYVFTNYTVDGGESVEFGWTPGTPYDWAGVSLPLWTPTLNKTDPNFGCDAYPDDTPDLSGYIVVARHVDGCQWDDQAKNAAAKGAKYMIGDRENYVGTYNITLDSADNITAVAGVTNLQMETWLDALIANSTIIVTMDDPDVIGLSLTYTPSPLAGHVDFFSTWGPTYEMDIKPQFGAPGCNILSTLPKSIAPTGFGVYSGTSMSTPLVAGIYALVAQARGTLDPALLQHLISQTAKASLHSQAQTYTQALNGGLFPYPAPVSHQGAGMVQAYDAAFATVVLGRTSIAFNDTANLVPDANFTITNLGNADVTFALGHVGAGTAYTFNPGEIKPAKFPDAMKVTTEYASIAFGESQVTIPAGGEATVTFTITPPDLDGRLLPVYSGFITGNGTNGENFALPYNGVVGSLNKVTIMADAYLSNSSDPDTAPIKNGTVAFVLPKDGCTDCSNYTVPIAFVDIAMGSRKLDVQVIDWETGNKLGSIASTDLPSPAPNVEREDPYKTAWNGTLIDKSQAPAGTYIFEFSALKIFGDLQSELSYEKRRSTPFSISYK